MRQIVLSIDGMMCGMCEAHINDAVRRAFTPQKVTSSHKKGQTVILTDADIPDDCLRTVITEAGYTFVSATRTTSDEVEKPRGWRAFFRK